MNLVKVMPEAKRELSLVKPTRFWNETCVKDVHDDVLYSLAEFCPGLPREADIVVDNRYMVIHPYRMLECISQYDGTGKKTDPNVEATISALLMVQVIPKREQTGTLIGPRNEHF